MNETSIKNSVVLGVVVILLFIGWLIPPAKATSEQGVMKVCFSTLPPWKMVQDGKAEGPGAEMMDLIGKELNLKVEFEIIPFKRCLFYMKNGEVDIMSGLLKNDERQDYIDFIEPAYKTKSNKAFYVLKGRKDSIQKYDDLLTLNIGTTIGSKYFARFDGDKNLKKHPTAIVEKNLLMLSKKRVDTIVATDSAADYLIYKMGLEDQIEKAVYGFNKNNPVYIGLSKASHLAAQKERIFSTIRDLIQNGRIDDLIFRYFTSRGLPVPDYK